MENSYYFDPLFTLLIEKNQYKLKTMSFTLMENHNWKTINGGFFNHHKNHWSVI